MNLVTRGYEASISIVNKMRGSHSKICTGVHESPKVYAKIKQPKWRQLLGERAHSKLKRSFVKAAHFHQCDSTINRPIAN